MSPTPIPPAAIGAGTPTSRSTFRALVKPLGATNREADLLRLRLLDLGDGEGLARRLRALDAEDPDGERGVEARLAVWFDALERPGEGPVSASADAVLDGLPPELRQRLLEHSRTEGLDDSR